MTAPPRTAPPQQAHPAQPTPDQGQGQQLVAEIAALLLVAAAASVTAAAIAALFRRRGVKASPEVVTLVLAVTGARTNTQPRQVGRGDVARGQARLEAYYRAAYVLNASQRIQAHVDAAVHEAEMTAGWDEAEAVLDRRRRNAAERALTEASRRERSFELAHERARRRRLEAAHAVSAAADRWGPVLGWHAHKDDRTTPECFEAHGSNFRVDRPPVIGWPGTLHAGQCRCRPGKPFPLAWSTDQATGFDPYGERGT